MNTTAKILVHHHELPWGRNYRTFEWVGPRTGVAWFGYSHRADLDDLPWPVKVVSKAEFIRGGWYVARADGTLAATWLFHTAKAAVMRLLTACKARLILTAMVWGMAYVPDEEIPSWRHLGRKRGGGSC